VILPGICGGFRPRVVAVPQQWNALSHPLEHAGAGGGQALATALEANRGLRSLGPRTAAAPPLSPLKTALFHSQKQPHHPKFLPVYDLDYPSSCISRPSCPPPYPPAGRRGQPGVQRDRGGGGVLPRRRPPHQHRPHRSPSVPVPPRPPPLPRVPPSTLWRLDGAPHCTRVGFCLGPRSDQTRSEVMNEVRVL